MPTFKEFKEFNANISEASNVKSFKLNTNIVKWEERIIDNLADQVAKEISKAYKVRSVSDLEDAQWEQVEKWVESKLNEDNILYGVFWKVIEDNWQ